MNSLFFDYLFTTINRQKSKHITLSIVLILLVFLLSSISFISSSLKHSLNSAVSLEPDFIVKSFRGGKEYFTPKSWEDKILNIYGVSKLTKRVYGRYYFDKKHFTLIVGVDVLDEQSSKILEKITQKADLKKFISGKYMIVGNGVKGFLSKNSFGNFYNFLTPNGKFLKLNVLSNFNNNTNIVTNDICIVPINVAKEILGIPSNSVTDFAFNVESKEERATIALKLYELFFDIKVVTKDDFKRYYNSLFNYKGGLFLILYLVTLTTFGLILYHRYSLVYSSEKRDIAILRAIGWSIKDILLFKFLEAFLLFFISFSFGIALAFFYVFYMGAPILKGIFLGDSNLKNILSFDIYFDTTVIFSIFLIFGILFIGSILMPTWRISITEPKEAMR